MGSTAYLLCRTSRRSGKPLGDEGPQRRENSSRPPTGNVPTDISSAQAVGRAIREPPRMFDARENVLRLLQEDASGGRERT